MYVCMYVQSYLAIKAIQLPFRQDEAIISPIGAVDYDFIGLYFEIGSRVDPTIEILRKKIHFFVENVVNRRFILLASCTLSVSCYPH